MSRMERRKLPSQSRLRELFDYCSSGNLVYKVSRGPRAAGWSTAVKKPTVGEYKTVGVDGSYFLLHRVIWAYHNGDPGTAEIDHKNGVRVDNRIKNLRIATVVQSTCNIVKKKGCSSKYVGVTKRKKHGTWQSYVTINGKQTMLGTFKTEREAFMVRRKAAEQHYGAFAAHKRAVV